MDIRYGRAYRKRMDSVSGYRAAAAYVGCSIPTIQRGVRRGKLTPTFGKNTPLGPERIFAIAQLEEFRKTWRKRRPAKKKDEIAGADNSFGPLAATVFKMIAAGKTLVEIVTACECDPKLVRQFEEDYRTSFQGARDKEKRRQALLNEKEKQLRFERQSAREEHHKRKIEAQIKMERIRAGKLVP